MSAPLTQALGAFVAAPGFDAVPQDVLPTVRNGFIDTLACLLSGRQEPVTRAALALASERSALNQSSVLLGSRKLGAMDAAFVNAVSGHALDYDDMALNGHPSVVLVPALLAAGECTQPSDQLLLRSYLVGYEVWAELMGREPDSLHNKGWHPTSVLGTVAVAAAVAHMEGLSASQASHALGMAASMASGLMGNFGSMTKPLHAGWAASHGIEAVRLARLGVTASGHALEGANGYLAAFSPKGNANRGPWTAPADLRIRHNGLSIKKYPVCYASHRVIDGVLELRRAHGIPASDVLRVVPTLSDINARVLHAHHPQTALEGKFSMEFAAAMALCEGAVGLHQVTDTQVQRDDVQALMQKVHIETVPPGCPVEPGFALHDRVVIELQDGTKLDSGPIRFASGHAQRALSATDIHTKFMGCVASHESGKAQTFLGRLVRLGEDPAASLCHDLNHAQLAFDD
jgi:2-methylcitrate dehydratase PrpD